MAARRAGGKPALQFAAKTAAPDSSVLLAWGALPGRHYQLQYKLSQLEPGWNNLGGVLTATNGILRATDPSASSQRFYRVVLLP